MEKYGYSDLGFAGPCAISNHQSFRMVCLLIERCMRNMKGLNPHASPCALIENNNIEIGEQGEKITEKDDEQKHKRINKLLEGEDFG